MKKILPVPYISQYSKDVEEEWHNRICGLACVAMLLGYYNLEDISLRRLLDEGLAIDGYSENRGWYHDALVRILRNHGVNAYAQEFRSVHFSKNGKDDVFGISPLEKNMLEGGLAKIIREIDEGRPVMASVNENFNTNLEKHIILIVGYDFTLGGEKLIVHDSRNPDNSETFIDMPVSIFKFMEYWRKFAIFSYR